MSREFCVCFLGTLLTSVFSWGAEPSSPVTIRFQRNQGVLLLHGADVAKALGLELKIVQPQRLITFCQSGNEGFCIPVQLTSENHQGTGENLMLAADVVRDTLQCQLTELDGTISVERRAPEEGGGVTTEHGYNAEWGSGRGFEKGDTLPDIPLVDMLGNEVRFSQFLGKRYILYCWASW